MVKKRQADLDVGTLPMKTRSAVSLVSHSKKKKNGAGGNSIFDLLKRNKKKQQDQKTAVTKQQQEKGRKNTAASASDTVVLFPSLSTGHLSPSGSHSKTKGSKKSSDKQNVVAINKNTTTGINHTTSKSQTPTPKVSKNKPKGFMKMRKKITKNLRKNTETKSEETIPVVSQSMSSTNSKQQTKKKATRPSTSNLQSNDVTTRSFDASLPGNMNALDNKTPTASNFKKSSKTFTVSCETPSVGTKRFLEYSDSNDLSASTVQKKVKPNQSSWVASEDESMLDSSRLSSRSNIQSALKDLANQTPISRSYAQESYCVVDSDVCDQDADSRTQALWTVADNSWIVAFSSIVELRGFVTATSLTKLGIVEIHGHELDYLDSVNVYSPPGYHNGVVEYHQPDNKGPTTPSMAELKEEFPSLSLKFRREITIFCTKHPSCALLLFSELNTPHLQTCIDMLPVPKISPGYISLAPRLLVSDCHVAPAYSSTTTKAIQYMVDHHKSGCPLRVLVCGHKNLGKSTLIKYIINRLLPSSENGVTHLECDPSQCEFSPPGCLTLHSVKQPQLGPPWTHSADKVDSAQVYGAISADVDPDRYVECMRRLAAEYWATDTPAPLVVNTMGWKEGLGLQFLAATIAEVKPTHVIQLCTDSASYKNFEPFTVFKLSAYDLYIKTDTLSKLHQDLQYELMPLTMYHNGRLEYESDVLSAMLTRDLTTTAYMFKSSLSHQRVINDIPPYCIDMCDIALDLGSDSLPAHLMWDAVRMQTVLLCQTSDNSISRCDNADFLKLSSSADLTVIGYGLVRAVDSSNKCVYVTTPLPIEQLCKVNVLYKIHGSITPELWYYQQLCKVRDDKGLPYFGCRKSGSGVVATADAKYKYRKNTRGDNSSQI